MKKHRDSNDGLAVVNYPAPHGMEAEVLYPGDVVQFGRGVECAIRFGYAPQPDQDVPRVAGELIVVNNRVFIESPQQLGHRALEIQAGGHSIQIPVGEGYSPREPKFDILVRGTTAPWKLSVTVRTQTNLRVSTNSSDPPTSHYSLVLTDLQRSVLAAYAEPLKQGRSEPATHREVADRLHYHPNTVREAIYEIWTMMFEQGVPMPDVTEKRAAVVEAARIHGLV